MLFTLKSIYTHFPVGNAVSMHSIYIKKYLDNNGRTIYIYTHISTLNFAEVSIINRLYCIYTLNLVILAYRCVTILCRHRDVDT